MSRQSWVIGTIALWPSALGLCGMPSTQAQIAPTANIADRQAEGAGYISALNNEQYMTFLTTGKFLTQLKASTYEISPITTNYYYQISARSTTTVHYAIARRWNLKSYVGRVAVVPSATGSPVITTILCENNRPGRVYPIAPLLDANLNLVCAPGTTKREPYGKSPQNKFEGRTTVSSMNRAQQAFLLDSGRFSDTIEPLGVGPLLPTLRYEYSVQASADFTLQYAIARRADFKSYVGAVSIFRAVSSSEVTTFSILCENDQPGPIRPPQPVIFSSGIACAAGTRLVGY
jgi:Type IV pilin-like G and H, putative